MSLATAYSLACSLGGERQFHAKTRMTLTRPFRPHGPSVALDDGFYDPKTQPQPAGFRLFVFATREPIEDRILRSLRNAFAFIFHPERHGGLRALCSHTDD